MHYSIKFELIKNYVIFSSNANNDANSRPSYLNSNNDATNANVNIRFIMVHKKTIA